MTRFGTLFSIRLASPVFAAGLAFALAGCVDTAVDLGAKQAGAASSARLVARPGVSPRGAAIALTSVDGAPEQVTQRFRTFFASAADSRDIATAPPAAAQYRVRGYLTAVQSQGVIRYSYVWDVFDRAGHRAQRLTDDVTVANAGDAWAALDDKTLTEIAGRGAGDLAAFLTNTPEAIAAANGAGAGVSVVAAQRAAPVSAPGGRSAGVADAR